MIKKSNYHTHTCAPTHVHLFFFPSVSSSNAVLIILKSDISGDRGVTVDVVVWDQDCRSQNIDQ